MGRAQDRAAGSDQDWEARADSLLEYPDLRYAAILDVMREVRYSDSVMTYLREAARAAEHRSAESFAVNSLGVIKRYASDYEAALQLSNEAEELAAEWQDTLAMVVARNSRGVVLRRADRIIEALDAHQAALELASQVTSPDFGTLRAIAISLNSKGQIHLTLDQPLLAEAAFEESLEVERRNDNLLGQAINLGNLGRIYEQRDELKPAARAYREAIVLNEAIESELGLAICYTGLAEVLAKQGKLREARAYAERAVPLAEKRGDDYYIAAAEIQLGRVALLQGDLERAELHLRRGLAISEEKSLLDEQMRTHFALAELAEARNQPAAALAAYRTGHDIERDVLSEKNRQYVNAVEARYDAAQRAAEIEQLNIENALVRDKASRNQRFAIAVIVALGLLAGVFALLYRQRRLKLQRDVAELEAQRLASQMNPHFLFNALNSIKAQLISADGRSASRLLDKFAKLMRRILGSSIDEAVTLEDELQSSRLYFDIENSRFNNSVTLRITVDPEVDPAEHRLPPLILQPFLENAILHGLRAKDGEKVLELEVQPRGKQGFAVVVRDNGVGRKAARETKRTSLLQRRSVGIDITERRLAHFARRQSREVDLTIRDLAAPDGSPAGTEVELLIA